MGNISFGERVRRFRVKNALSQTELGERIGVSQMTVSNWETGKLQPSSEQREALTRILGIEPGARKTGTEPDPGAAGPSTIGAWLARQRVERGMSVAELAASSGVSAPAIYNIESGRISNPRKETISRFEKALGRHLPEEARREVAEEASIEGLGEFVEFDPHDDDDRPSLPGVYVLYDISQRPIYVGQGGDIRKRIRDHHEKFWFKSPIVSTAAYVKIEDKLLREQVETLLIRFLKNNAVINKQNVER